MSNSRTYKRSVKRNVGTVGMAALGTVTVAGGLMALPGTAFALSNPSPTTVKIASSGAPNVFPGQNNQPAGSITLTINNSFNKGDTIDIPIMPAGSANGTVSGETTPAYAVTYSATPTVTVSGPNTNSSSDITPTVTTSLVTNSADSAADQDASIKDELVLTIGDYSAGTTSDTYTFTISGIKYNVGSSAPSETVDVQASYTNNSTSPSTTEYFSPTGRCRAGGPGGRPWSRSTRWVTRFDRKRRGTTSIHSYWRVLSLAVSRVGSETVLTGA